jgi:tripartite-type tricarboxylate transporter receptor subunit TctC
MPTLVESGYPGLEIVIWNAVVAPAGTPAEITTKLGAEILSVATLPDVVQSFARQGAEMTPRNAAELGAYMKSELAKFARVVKESGARID